MIASSTERGGDRAPRRSPRGVIAACALVLAACGGASSAAPAPRLQRAEPEPPAARVHVLFPPLFGLQRDGALIPDRELAHLGPNRFVFEGFRVELAGAERALVSEQAFLSGITDARRCGEGWVFVTRRGTIGYAGSFTGPTRRIGTVAWIDHDLRHALRVNEGVVLYVDGHGGALTGRCEGPLVPVGALPGDLVSDVWGAGARRLAIVGGRHLYRSEDDGRTWARVPIDGGLPRAIARDGRVRVADSRWIAVDATGRAAPAEAPSPDDERWVEAPVTEPAIEGGAARASAELLRQSAAARAALRPRLEGGGVMVSDGENLWLALPGEGAPPINGAERSDGRPTPAPMPSRSGATHVIDVAGDPGCRGGLAWVGRRLLRLCSDVTAITEDGGRRMREVVLPETVRGRGVRAADDGSQVVFRGPCEGEYDDDARCVVNVDTEAARTLELPPESELLAVHGDHALVIAPSDDGYELVRLVVGSRRREVLHVEEDASLPMAAGRAGPEGAFVAVFAIPDEPPRVATSEGATLRWSELPPGASHVGFLDTRFGVAAGETSDALWITEDGARTWRPLPDPFESPVSLRERPGHALRPHLPCDPAGCSVGALWIERGAPLDPAPRWVAPGEREAPGPVSIRSRSLTLACDGPAPSGDSGTAPPPLDQVRIERAGSRRVVVWSRDGAGGSFTARSAPVRLADLGASREPSCAPLALTPRRALIRCCITEPVEPGVVAHRCRAIGVTAGGGALAIELDPRPEDVSSTGDRIFMLEDGGHEGTRVFELEDGGARLLRTWRWPARVFRGTQEHHLALDLVGVDGAPALLRQLRRPGGQTASVELLDEDAAASAVGLPERGPIPVCRASDSGGLELRVEDVAASFEGSPAPYYGVPEVTLTLRLDGERTCLRAVEHGLEGISLRAEQGRLRGAFRGRPVDLGCAVRIERDDR